MNNLVFISNVKFRWHLSKCDRPTVHLIIFFCVLLLFYSITLLPIVVLTVSVVFMLIRFYYRHHTHLMLMFLVGYFRVNFFCVFADGRSSKNNVRVCISVPFCNNFFLSFFRWCREEEASKRKIISTKQTSAKKRD